MKAKITSVKYEKEYESKFGILYTFKIGYNDKVAYYSSKTKEQTKFVVDKEAEFTEEEKLGTNDRPYYVIKPITSGGFNNSGYGKAIQKEQSKYSGFAVSYVKDLIIADKIKIEQWESASEKILVVINYEFFFYLLPAYRTFCP